MQEKKSGQKRKAMSSIDILMEAEKKKKMESVRHIRFFI
jgi:hypothetical protein